MLHWLAFGVLAASGPQGLPDLSEGWGILGRYITKIYVVSSI